MKTVTRRSTYEKVMAYLDGGDKPDDSQIMREIDYAMQYYGNPRPAAVIFYGSLFGWCTMLEQCNRGMNVLLTRARFGSHHKIGYHIIGIALWDGVVNVQSRYSGRSISDRSAAEQLCIRRQIDAGNIQNIITEQCFRITKGSNCGIKGRNAVAK